MRRKIVMVMSLEIQRPAIHEILEILENPASLANLASRQIVDWVAHKMMKVIVVVAAVELVVNMFVVVHSIGMVLYYL